MSSITTAQQPPTHTTESIADRRKQRELAEARQSGNAAPEIDVKTGAIINPHNPEFLTRRPWYLGGGEDVEGGPSLDHQSDQRALQDRVGLTLGASDFLVQKQRQHEKQLRQQGFRALKPGMYLEGLKRNRKPYLIAKVIRIDYKREIMDVEYEDGTKEKKIKWKATTSSGDPKLRLTKSGARTALETGGETEREGIIIGKETYDSKRDAYHGMQVEDQQRLVHQQFLRREELRKQRRARQLERKEKGELQDEKEIHDTSNKKHKGSDSDSDSDSDYDSDAGSDSDEEFVQKDEDAKIHTSRMARQGGVGGAQMKVTARNLRIREDTAKYLRNLDLDSAYYDPKSRSMRDNPYQDANPSEVPFAGDNFTRVSGDAFGLAETQVFAWDAADKGVTELHPQANPSQAELLKKQFKDQSKNLKQERKKAVLDKYGGAEYLDGKDGLAESAPTKADDETENQRKIRFGTSTQMQEYTTDGRVVKPGSKHQQQQKSLISTKSKYEEDVFVNGHTTVFGSYFHKGAFRWGYADDHSLLRNSYCTGINGRLANDEANALQYGDGREGSAQLAQMRQIITGSATSGSGTSKSDIARNPIVAGSKMYGEANQFAKFDQSKIEAAIAKQEVQEKKENSDRKRGYNSINASEVDMTEEEMEAYRLRKRRGEEDPMANITDSDQLLEYK